MRRAGIAVMLLAAFIVAFISGCTETQVVDLDVSTVQTINDTKVIRNESRYILQEEEGLKPVPADTQEWLCSEKVLLAMRSCKWDKENIGNLDIIIINNGYMNITMAFYLYDKDGKKIGDAFNDTLFPVKSEWNFRLPFSELEKKYGKIEKIQAAPVLMEGDNILSCTNKILPVLVDGCG